MESQVKPGNSVIESVFVAVDDNATIDVKDILKSCRCCLRRPPGDSHLGDMEIYLDILKECFNILVTEAENTPGICDECVDRLQEASDFRLQVLHCQEQLQEWLEANQAADEPVVKCEENYEDQDETNGDTLSCLDSKQELTIKLETEDDEDTSMMLFTADEEAEVKSNVSEVSGSNDYLSPPQTDGEHSRSPRQGLLKSCSVRLKRLCSDEAPLMSHVLQKRKRSSNSLRDNTEVHEKESEDSEDWQISASSTKTKRGLSWTEEGLRAAIDAVKSGKVTQRTASKNYNIPRRTLKGHLERGSITKRMGRKPIFTKIQESELSAILKRFSEIGVPLTPEFIRKQAYLFCDRYDIQNNFDDLKQTAGPHWLKTFLKRNPSISVKKQKINQTRAQIQRSNKVIAEQHFHTVKTLYNKSNIPLYPERLYNMGVKECRMINHEHLKLDEEKGHLSALEHPEKLTICMCINAIGTSIPPFIIIEGQKPVLNDDLPLGTLVRIVSKGMRPDLFLEFIQHLGKYKVVGKCILVFDAAKWDLSCEALDEAEKNDIVLYCLPSNFRHVLQPLHKVTKAFEHPWGSVMNLKANADKRFTKATFNENFNKFWANCVTGSNIMNGFKSTGLFPFNPEAIAEEAFTLSQTSGHREIEDLDFSVGSRDSEVSTSRRKRGDSWTEEGLRAAMNAVKTGKLTQRSACKKFNIPRRTLRGHLDRGSVKKRMGRKPIFTESQESDLAAEIKKIAKLGVSITPEFIRNQANLFCERYDIKHNFNHSKQTIGADWLKQFLKRHPSLSIKNNTNESDTKF